MDIFNVIKQYKKNKLTMKRVSDLLSSKGFYGTTIYNITQENDVITMEIGLPPSKELVNVKTMLLRNLQQEFMAEDSEISKSNGKFITMRFGMNKLRENYYWSYKMLYPNTLKINLISSYSDVFIDFSDGASCHMLSGGASRMGKTNLLFYLMTNLYIQNSGDIDIHISSAKLKDYYPFFDCKNFHFSENQAEMEILLKNLINEYKRRKKLLYSKDLLHATDGKSIKKLYPHMYHNFKPIFLIIDEYARFSDNKDIQKLTEEIVETAGYVNIHVIIASQRPDNKTVLTARIRQNLSCRLGFHCENRGNSEIILGKSGAEFLPKIPGRGVLIDKEEVTVQVPYLEPIECYNILKPFRKSGHNERTGSTNNKSVEEIQSNVEESISIPGVSKEQQSSSDNQSSIETYVPTWFNQSNT